MHRFYACDIFVLYFPFLKQFWIWLLTKNTRVCIPPSVYDALKYFTETVTPRTFSKFILPHCILSYNSFYVNMFSRNFLLCVPAFGHVSVKNFIEYWNFEILNDSLEDSLWFKSFHILTQTTIIQNCFPESGHATVKHLIKT